MWFLYWLPATCMLSHTKSIRTGVVNVNAKFTSTDMRAEQKLKFPKLRMAYSREVTLPQGHFPTGSPGIGVWFRLPAQMNNVQYFGHSAEEAAV